MTTDLKDQAPTLINKFIALAYCFTCPHLLPISLATEQLPYSLSALSPRVPCYKALQILLNFSPSTWNDSETSTSSLQVLPFWVLQTTCLAQFADSLKSNRPCSKYFCYGPEVATSELSTMLLSTHATPAPRLQLKLHSLLLNKNMTPVIHASPTPDLIIVTYCIAVPSIAPKLLPQSVQGLCPDVQHCQLVWTRSSPSLIHIDKWTSWE